jgi:hypothetical protein
MPDPQPEPRPERTPEDLDEAERARGLRKLSRLLQAGGVVFLVVVSLGLLPEILAERAPALSRALSLAMWIVAPVLTLGLVVLTALRLRR